MSYNSEPISPKQAFTWFAVILAALGLLVALIVGIIFGFKLFGRSQALADAKNQAHVARIHAANQTQVNELLISANQQQVKIHQQQADIRLADAVGVRKAQDEISSTLTPLYVSWEAVQAMEKIAESGKNNTVVYLPSGPMGVPIVQNLPTQPAH